MNHVPRFIAIVLLLSIVVIFLGWRQERQFFHRPGNQPIEPNTLLLSGLTFWRSSC
ncbi:MAG: hypothetical protein R2932_39325 [Caldilineaceae bacterium]